MTLVATLLLFIAACGERTPQFAPLRPDAVIVAFGDSLTYGIGAEPQASYPAVLERLLKRRVVNAGVPGEVSSEGLARLPAVLDEFQPALLILCHGGNDMLRKLDPTQLTDNLRAMVMLAHQRNIPVVLMGVPEPRIALAPAAMYAQLAAETGTLYEGNILAETLQWPSTKSDMIHPNAAGYQKIAEALRALLAKAHLAP